MSDSGPWPKYPLLYEINTRVWLAELATRAGRPMMLDQVPDEELELIAGHGFHAVWLMGVWTTGAAPISLARGHSELQAEYKRALPDVTTEDVIGSPYAISEYRVADRLGGPVALAGLRERLARHGMRLMLDFVCNHTAFDHPLVLNRPDIFINGTAEDLAREPDNFFKNGAGAILAHGRDPGFPAWTDTAQINYAQSAAREAMLNELLSIAAQCDGVRCDMAMLVLPEVFQRIWGNRQGTGAISKSFWSVAIGTVLSRNPDFIFLGESYWELEWQLQQEGFHFTYDKTLYDRLHRSDFDGVRQHLAAGKNFQDRCARFIENHDEPRAVTAFGAAGSQSAAVTSFFSSGLRLFHEGQLEGRRVKIPVQLGRRPPENEDAEIALFYERTMSVLQDPVFHSGHVTQHDVHSTGWGDTSNESLAALFWEQANPSVGASLDLGRLIVVNLSGTRSYGRIPLSSARFLKEKKYIFLDRYDGKRYEREGDELNWPGLFVALEGHQFHLFEIQAQ